MENDVFLSIEELDAFQSSLLNAKKEYNELKAELEDYDPLLETSPWPQLEIQSLRSRVNEQTEWIGRDQQELNSLEAKIGNIKGELEALSSSKRNLGFREFSSDAIQTNLNFLQLQDDDKAQDIVEIIERMWPSEKFPDLDNSEERGSALVKINDQHREVLSGLESKVINYSTTLQEKSEQLQKLKTDLGKTTKLVTVLNEKLKQKKWYKEQKTAKFEKTRLKHASLDTNLREKLSGIKQQKKAETELEKLKLAYRRQLSEVEEIKAQNSVESIFELRKQDLESIQNEIVVLEKQIGSNSKTISHLPEDSLMLKNKKIERTNELAALNQQIKVHSEENSKILQECDHQRENLRKKQEFYHDQTIHLKQQLKKQQWNQLNLENKVNIVKQEIQDAQEARRCEQARSATPLTAEERSIAEGLSEQIAKLEAENNLMQKTSQGEIAENKMQLRSVKETNSKLDLKIHELHEQIKLENRRMHDLLSPETCNK